MPKASKPSPRYASDILAWEYDQRQPLPLPREMEWYQKYSPDYDNPILELACGSGRLLVPIAQVGHKIHGVDSSLAMLNRLQQKLTALEEKIFGNISLFHSDILEFKPSKAYELVMIAYNSVREFETAEKVAACFKHVHNLLSPGGYFLFTIRRLIPSSASGEETQVYNSIDKPFTDPTKEISVGVRITSCSDSNHRMVNKHSYIIESRNQPAKKIDFVTYTNMLDKVDYEKILDNLAFQIKAYGGYDECPDDERSKEICFVCRK